MYDLMTSMRFSAVDKNGKIDAQGRKKQSFVSQVYCSIITCEFEMVHDSPIPTSHPQDTEERGGVGEHFWCTCLSSYLIVPSSDALHSMYGVSGAVASLFTRPIWHLYTCDVSCVSTVWIWTLASAAAVAMILSPICGKNYEKCGWHGQFWIHNNQLLEFISLFLFFLFLFIYLIYIYFFMYLPCNLLSVQCKLWGWFKGLLSANH